MQTFPRLQDGDVYTGFVCVEALHVVVLGFVCGVPVVHEADGGRRCEMHSFVFSNISFLYFKKRERCEPHSALSEFGPMILSANMSWSWRA